MEPIEAQAAQVDRWYTNAKGTRVQVKAILHEGVVVEKAPGQTTTVPLTYPLTPVEEAAPTVGGITAADLAGRPKPLVEASLASLPTDQLLELSRLDSRIWLGVEIERLLKRRQTEAPAAPAAAAPTPAAQKPPETGWCLVCRSEVGVRKPMTVKAHMNAIGGACTGVGTKALDHAPTDADREAEDEAGEQAWREGRPIPDMDDEGRPRPLAADGWTRARDYWRSLDPEPKIRNAPTESLALQVLGSNESDSLDLEALVRLRDECEMENPPRPSLMAALERDIATERESLAHEASAQQPAPLGGQVGSAVAADPLQAQEPQDLSSDPPGPPAEEAAANAETPGPEPMVKQAVPSPPPLSPDDPKYVRIASWLREVGVGWVEGHGQRMHGKSLDYVVRLVAAAQAKLVDAKAVLQEPEVLEHPSLLRIVGEYELGPGFKRAGLVSWIERHLGAALVAPTAAAPGPEMTKVDVAVAVGPSSDPPLLSVPDVVAVTAFQERLERLQVVVKALRDLVPYVVAANQLCEEAGDLGLVVDIQDLVNCRLNAD